MFKKRTFYILFFVFIFVSCNKKEKSDTLTLINRGSYSSRYIDGLQVFIKDNQVMDGYYVVGKDLIKWEEFELKKGILNGSYITYHPNGKMSSNTQYRNGKMHGEEQLFYPSGELLKIVHYQNNKQVGEIKEFYEGGQIKKLSKIKDEKIYESVFYNNVGNMVSQMFIKDGLRIRQNILEGKIFSEYTSSTYDDNKTMKFYNQDGTVKKHLRMYENNNTPVIIELDENGEEKRRIDFQKNPEEAHQYLKLWKG